MPPRATRLVALTCSALFALCGACRSAPSTDAPRSTPQLASAAPPAATVSGAPDAGFAPELVSFPSGALTLGGFVWRPPGAGPFPAIVFNHGSEALPGAKDGQDTSPSTVLSDLMKSAGKAGARPHLERHHEAGGPRLLHGRTCAAVGRRGPGVLARRDAAALTRQSRSARSA